MDTNRLLTVLRRPILFLLAIPIAVMIGTYLLLFSTTGNRLLQPYFTSTLSELYGAPVIVNTFVLTPNHYTLLFHDKDKNHFSLDGTYSLSTLDSHGVLKAFGGNADYTITFKDLSVDILQLSIHHIDLATLLHHMDYPSKSKSSLNGKIYLLGLANRKITGNIDLWSTTNSFTPSAIIDEDSNLSLDLYDWLADENGRVRPFKIDCTATIKLDEIGVIEQLIGYPMRGNIALESRMHGNQESLNFDFNSNVAKSHSQMQVLYKALFLNQINYTVSHADVKSVFDLFNMPAPISGVLDSTGSISPKSGSFRLTMHHARTKPTVLKQEYGITQPDLRFDSQVNAKFSGDNTIHYQASIRSNLGRLELDNTTSHTQMLAELLRSLR